MNNEISTKDFILQKAISLFSQKGYDGVGVQEICSSAEITKPTLYYYFGSKSGVLQNIADTYGEQLCNLVQAAAEYQHDFMNSLTKILKCTIQFAQNNKDFFSLHCLLISAPENTEIKNIYSPIKEKLDSIIYKFFKNSVNEFGNMKGKEKLYSILFHNNLYSVTQCIMAKTIKNTEQTIYQIIHSFMYGVAN